MAASARRATLIAIWGSRLRRGLAEGRQALLRPGPLTAAVTGAAVVGVGALWYQGRLDLPPGDYLTVFAQKNDDEEAEKLSIRKQRFMQFSSLEYEGEHYMTPRDFLYSVMFDHIERKASIRQLTKKAINDALDEVTKNKNGPTFFRDLGDKGVISYTEYLFLLTVLTKPHTGFHVAFKMLDIDGDETVDKKEFFKLQKIISKQDDLRGTTSAETMFQESKEEDSGINTTLQVYFFGKGGKKKLHYKEFRSLEEFKSFCKFATHLEDFSITMEMFRLAHRPVKLAEFKRAVKVATGQELSDNILDTVFKIFDLDGDDCLSHGEFLGVLKSRKHRGLLSLEEFKSFCKFATHLEDFSITMEMFRLAHRPVKLAEFKRAVKVATGQELSDNILDTVFKIFDLDGDDCLSHGEFLGVLKSRKHRGLLEPQQPGIQEYWKCVKRESIKALKEVWKQTGKNYS
ncbi:calcium uptake protein 2, mitochondrial [Antechinus flavipes]|uniref:calcium uptake protein 2, mitochondrial n=1 Tax=Antechinus flavipes TaxID=38775 RepID=UPI0022356F29|nr:calcium uptake protein 2, mitochondrial [Antechinus flavipes]